MVVLTWKSISPDAYSAFISIASACPIFPVRIKTLETSIELGMEKVIGCITSFGNAKGIGALCETAWCDELGGRRGSSCNGDNVA